MPRKGENIYKRKDGRWEGRYIRSYDSEHKAKYAYVYGKTYSEVKRKLTEQRGKRPVNLSGELAQTGISLKSVEKSDYEAYIKNYFDEYFVLLQASEDVPALMKIFYHGRYFSSFIDDYISVLKKMAKKETERWKRILGWTCVYLVTAERSDQAAEKLYKPIVRYLRSLDEDGLLDVRQAVIQDIPSSRCDYLFDEVRRKEGLGLLWLIDRIYIMINKIKNACPNPDCQAPFLIPTYECPGCGEKHTNLVPSKYGILKRTCLCGTKLPTTFLNGRGQLKAYCPECDTALSGDTASRQYAFPVIGGPSVGKTCFINMAIDQMMSDVAPARSWEMSFISDTEEKDHALAMKSLNQGVRLMKTELNSLTAYQLMLKLPNEKIGRRIYVYDISGEMFSSSSDVQNNLAYSYANGFIFIIDPLTLNQFAMDVEDKVDLNAYGASSKDFDDILNIMLINLEKMFGLKDKDTLKSINAQMSKHEIDHCKGIVI